MKQLHDLLRAQMTPLQYENMLLKQQVWDLAYKIDPRFWEAVVRESAVEAAEKVDNDIRDQRTSPRIRATTAVIWKAPGCVIERMGIR